MAPDASCYGWMGSPAASFYPAAASCSAQPPLPHPTAAACTQAQPQGFRCAATQPKIYIARLCFPSSAMIRELS